MEPRAAQSGILFTAVGLTDFDPPRVIASPRYMNRILSNVIGNAIKYNKPGGAVGFAPPGAESAGVRRGDNDVFGHIIQVLCKIFYAFLNAIIPFPEAKVVY